MARAKKVVAERGYELIEATKLPRTEFVPTGHAALDQVIKGFPRKRVTEVWGPSGAGKSTLLLSAIGALDKNLTVLYIDLENTLDADWINRFGIKKGQMMLASPLILEDAAQLVLDQLDNFDLIVFDSVGAALFKTEQQGEFGQANVGVKPKLMTSFMRKLIGPLARSKTAMVFINQEKPVIGELYGPKTYTPGGKALEYAASMRIRLTSAKADYIFGKGIKVGKEVKAKVIKNKVGPDDQEATFTILIKGSKTE